MLWHEGPFQDSIVKQKSRGKYRKVGRNTEERLVNRSWSKAGVAAGKSYSPKTNLPMWVFGFHHFPNIFILFPINAPYNCKGKTMFWRGLSTNFPFLNLRNPHPNILLVKRAMISFGIYVHLVFKLVQSSWTNLYSNAMFDMSSEKQKAMGFRQTVEAFILKTLKREVFCVGGGRGGEGGQLWKCPERPKDLRCGSDLVCLSISLTF